MLKSWFFCCLFLPFLIVEKQYMLKARTRTGVGKRWNSKRNTVKQSLSLSRSDLHAQVPVLLPRGHHNQYFNRPLPVISIHIHHTFPFCFIYYSNSMYNFQSSESCFSPHSITDLGEYSISEYKALAYSFKQLCIPGDMP